MNEKTITFNATYINMLLMVIVSSLGLGHTINTGNLTVGIYCGICLLLSGWMLLFDIPKTTK